MTAFTDPLPLRTTAAWAGFRAVRVIPHRYGETAGELIQYDQARQLFVWSDHAVQAIDSVTVDDQNATGWRWYNGADSTGKPVGWIDAGIVTECRDQVQSDRHQMLVVHLARGSVPLVADNKRYTNGLFVKDLFMLEPMGRVQVAVIAGEDYHRILLIARIVKRMEYLGDVGVDHLGESAISPTVQSPLFVRP